MYFHFPFLLLFLSFFEISHNQFLSPTKIIPYQKKKKRITVT